MVALNNKFVGLFSFFIFNEYNCLNYSVFSQPIFMFGLLNFLTFYHYLLKF